MRDAYVQHECRNGSLVRLYRSQFGARARTEIYMPPPSGVRIDGEPHDTDSYRAEAERLGYGADVDTMCLHHDPLHALISDFFGAPYSFSMAYAAGELPKDEVWKGKIEERAVLACQEYMVKCGLKFPIEERIGRPRVTCLRRAKR